MISVTQPTTHMTNNNTVKAYLLGDKETGSNGLGSLSFEHDVMYSYVTRVAKKVLSIDGNLIVQITNIKYSNTTTKQCSMLKNECRKQGIAWAEIDPIDWH